MNYREIFHYAVATARVLLFCMFTAPALTLFFVVLLFALRGSLTGWYIEDARNLVGNAPSGMVMKCMSSELLPSLPGDVPPPQYVNPEPCTKVPVNESTYTANGDSTLLYWWKLIAIVALGFQGMWWAARADISNLLNILLRR